MFVSIIYSFFLYLVVYTQRMLKYVFVHAILRSQNVPYVFEFQFMLSSSYSLAGLSRGDMLFHIRDTATYARQMMFSTTLDCVFLLCGCLAV